MAEIKVKICDRCEHQTKNPVSVVITIDEKTDKLEDVCPGCIKVICGCRQKILSSRPIKAKQNEVVFGKHKTENEPEKKLDKK